jgi:predicted ATPase
MLREMVLGLEALTADTPLILVLEDLHWSDQSTLAFIAALARRTDKARVLVLGSYRNVEAGQTPLAAIVRELLLHRQADELPWLDWS